LLLVISFPELQAMDRAICQKQIARELGLSQSTVSLALRRKKGVHPKTIEKVHAMARRLGYVPDPMLGSLASYRSRSRPVVFRSVLPWLHTDKGLIAHRDDLPWGRILAGAGERAGALGFKLEPMWVSPEEYRPDAFARMLKSRGVMGAICGPSITGSDWFHSFEELGFPQVHVGVYASSEVSRIHVSADHYQNARKFAHAIESRKTGRALVVLEPRLESILLRQYESLFLRLSHEKGRATEWMLSFLNQIDAFCSALADFNPDLLVLPGADQYKRLQRELPAPVWERILHMPVGFLCLPRDLRHPGGCCGMDEQLEEIGAAGVDQMGNLIASRHIHADPPAIRLLIEGKWVEVPGF
jgi:DNA-binding LacI/PurR family transcriptional regulator